MSLKQVFILMGSVSFLMIVAVIYTKVGRPGHVSYGEVRAIDRLCQRSADDIMIRLSKESIQSEKEFIAQIHTCLKACRGYLIQSRAKGVKLGGASPMEIPECLLIPDKKLKTKQPSSFPAQPSKSLPSKPLLFK